MRYCQRSYCIRWARPCSFVLNDKLNDAESWLYGDGFDEAKAVYQMKLDELKSLGDPPGMRVFLSRQ
jgi:hypothetical protein